VDYRASARAVPASAEVMWCPFTGCAADRVSTTREEGREVATRRVLATRRTHPSRPVHEVTCLEVFLILRFYENLKAITDAEAAMRHRLARSSFAMSVSRPGLPRGAGLQLHGPANSEYLFIR